MLSKERAQKNAGLVKQLNLLGVAVPSSSDDFDDAMEIASAKTKEANNLLKRWSRKPKKAVQVEQQDQDDEVVKSSGELERPRSPTQIQQEEDAKSAINLAQRVLDALNYDYRITNMETRVQNAALSAAAYAKDKLANAMEELLHESEDSHGDLEEENNYQSAATLADAAVERIIQFYTSLNITLDDGNLKAPPGLTKAKPAVPEAPKFLSQSSKPNNEPPPVPPSREVRTDAPPSGMPEVNHEEVLDRAASFDSSNSSSGMDRPPLPIPSQSGDSDEEIDRASTPSFSDTEEEGFEESEAKGIPDEAMTDVTNDEENKLLANTKKLFANLANNEGIESNELIAVFEAVDADSTTPRYWNNLYAAVAGYVFAEPTPEYIQNNAGQGIFESNVKKDPKIYEVMLELYRLLNSHSHHQSFGDETISMPGDDNLDKISLQGLVKAMYPILNSADMTHAAKKAESKATIDLRNTSAANKPSQRKVTFDSRIPTTTVEENAKSKSRVRAEKVKNELYNKHDQAVTQLERMEIAEQLKKLERHYDPNSPFIFDEQEHESNESRDSVPSIDSDLGIEDESPEDEANSIPSLESDDELEHESTELNATVDNGEDRLSHDVQKGNPTTPVPDEFWTRPDDTFADLYLAMLEGDARNGFENFYTKEDLNERIKTFFEACKTYFVSEQTPTADAAKNLKTTFDVALKPIVDIINHNTANDVGREWDDYRRDLKLHVADQLAELANSIFDKDRRSVITKEAINGASALESIAMAAAILNISERVESGGGGYCGDRSIIQSVRDAIRRNSIDITEDHELYAVFKPRDTVGNEQPVSEEDAKAFRGLFVEYLRGVGVSEPELATIGDEENVYWLTDQDMNDIAKWLKIDLNVVQNVEDRDVTYRYKPEVGAESIGTINIFNQGYVNQDGIHYQALLPISRAEFRDSDYVHVDPVTAEGETSSSEFDQIPSEFGASSDEEPLDMNDIVPPAHGRLTAEQLAAIAGIDQSRRERRQEESRSPSPSPEANATVSNKRGGFLSGLKNRVLNNKKASSSKTATVEPNRPVSPLHEELARNQRFQEQQRQESALFGTPSEQRNNDLTYVTPMPPDRNSSGLRRRNRVQDSTTAPTVPTNNKPARTPFAGFVGPAPESLRETVQQNSSEEAVTEQTPVITTPHSTSRANSSRVIEPEELPEEEVRAFELDVHAIPRPVAPKSLVAMVRGILDDPNNNTELDYVDTKVATKIEIVTKGEVPVQVATITDRKYDDPPGKLGTVTASGVSGKDTYDAMSATLKLIAAMPDAERTAYIHPVTVRNITTREQVIGATRALYEYCVQVSGSTLAAEQAEALKDIYIIRDGSEAFKQALHEFLNDIPTLYSNEYDQGEYNDFIKGLLKPPTVSMTSGESSRRFRTHPPITPYKQPALPYQPLFGLLDGYTPPKSFMGSMLSGVKRRLTGGPTDDNPKSPRVI